MCLGDGPFIFSREPVTQSVVVRAPQLKRAQCRVFFGDAFVWLVSASGPVPHCTMYPVGNIPAHYVLVSNLVPPAKFVVQCNAMLCNAVCVVASINTNPVAALASHTYSLCHDNFCRHPSKVKLLAGSAVSLQ